MGLLSPQKLSPEDTEHLIAHTSQWILSVCKPCSLILFGSAARGEMTVASDLDIAIVFADDQELTSGRNAIYASITKNTAIWSRDLLFYTLEGFRARLKIGGVVELISSEGRILYGSKP